MTEDKRPDIGRPHLLTVAVEDYFQATALGKLVPANRWSRFESRIEHNTIKTLDLLSDYNAKATFFVLGWIADEIPSVLTEIVKRGHEVASKGYYHQSIHKMTTEDFRADVRKSKNALELATGVEIVGFRIAQGHFHLEDLWALEILRQEGYRYDSSMFPRFRSISSEPWRRFPHVVHTQNGDIWELPLSSWGPDLFLIPAAGGNYFRQVPSFISRFVVKHWTKSYLSPFNMYFNIWELDQDLPKFSATNFLTRLRLYRNLGKMSGLYREVLEKYQFQGLAYHLDIEQESIRPDILAEGAFKKKPQPNFEQVVPNDREPVTIVIPCYNEEMILPYLAKTFLEVEAHLSKRWQLNYLFVDDGSSDNTWEILKKHFGNRPDCRFVRHWKNRGVGAAILTGIQNARTEIICSIDCDCTYDPLQLGALLPMLNDDVSMVTASPYHPKGQVLNVPGWRLFLSRGLSWIYRIVLTNKLSTYTSCFRVYRRSSVKNIILKNENFLGVLETLAVLDLKGEQILECPAVLEARMLGVSKMKTLSTINEHIGFLFKLLIGRAFSSNRSNGRIEKR